MPMAIASVIQIIGTYSALADFGTATGLPIPTIDYVGQYARCPDLFGNKTGLVQCIAFNGKYAWQPTQEFWYSTATIVGGSTLNLIPLRMGQNFRATGNVSGLGASIAPSVVGAWPGQRWNIGFDGVLTLVGLNITGVTGGAIPLVSGTRKDIIFNGTSWEPV